MLMIAIGTIHGSKVIRPPVGEKGQANYRPGKFEEIVIAPGNPFDTEVLGIGSDEADKLIAQGAAKRQTREVPVEADAGEEKLKPKS
jgi:hypothetical protein